MTGARASAGNWGCVALFSMDSRPAAMLEPEPSPSGEDIPASVPLEFDAAIGLVRERSSMRALSSPDS